MTISGRVCGREATLSSGNLLLSPKKTYLASFNKREGFIAHVTGVGTPVRAEHDLLVVIFDIFWPIHDAFVAGEQHCDLEIPSWALKSWLMIIYWKEWLIANATAICSPAKAEGFLVLILGVFINSSYFCCWGATLWAGNPLLRPKSLPLYYLTKMEGLIAGIITTGGPVSAASGFWGDFVFCWHVQAAFCGQRASLWAVNPLSSRKKPTDDH